MPGPIPNAEKRRRNAPTIPTTQLPIEGRNGRAPALPETYKLAKAGRAWWRWAWKLPQATAWDSGVLYVVARRAQLEDDLKALDGADGFNVEEILGSFDPDEERELGKHVEFLIRKLKGLAGGRIGVMKEMRELDNRLGLNPKAMADLRWAVVDDGTQPEQPTRRKVNRRRAHLTAVK